MNLKWVRKNIIFISAIVFTLLICIWGTVFQDTFISTIDKGFSIALNQFSWLYSGLMLIFFLFTLWMGFGRFKKIRLGEDNSKPEFSNLSWIAMLFSAGIGIGLVFWGVAEPLTHYINPMGVEGITAEAKEFAFTKSFLHWGISAWACYVVLALALSYIHFRKKQPLLVSSLLSPLFKNKKVNSIVGKIVDIMTVFATIAGIVTSLGMGTLQIGSGLNYLFGVPESNGVKIAIVVVITILFLISACTGVKKGIKYLSNLNILIAIGLFVMALFVGPFGDMVSNLLLGLKGYAIELLSTNNKIFTTSEWHGAWTIFYWGWWIAWAPSVAIFIARISKGRTIGEFVFYVLVIPSICCILWMDVFGTMGISAPIEVGMVAIERAETSLFMIFETYPLGIAMSMVAIVLLFTFFVTSADSATYVLGMIVSNGNTDVSRSKKIILGIMMSSLTLVLLFAGGLEMVQNASIIVALPFGIVMLLSIIGFTKELYNCETKQNEIEIEVREVG